MPILKVEMIAEGSPEAGLAQRLADRAGELFEAPGQTWVRVQTIPPQLYAENSPDPPPRPVFVSVLMWKLPPVEERAQLAAALAVSFAQAIGCSPDHVHIIFEADGNERVAFGGELVTD